MRILVVEDNRTLADGLLAVLRSSGYAVDVVHDGLSALAALYRVTPSAVSRSLAKARATLIGQVRTALMARLRLSGREVDSVLLLVQSQLELSRSMLDEGR